ncbi:MAG: clostripain-related cysteine peptidase, partial [Elusimicrobia bacterium]|nr:clostripain-related cysteine peptidase [Elusimicrobiota bacterium]
INAKNNLESAGMMNVNQMEKIGSTDKVKIAVEMGRIGGYDSSDGDWKAERRYIIQKDNNPNHISSPVLQELHGADMGSWQHLVDFVTWAKQVAPAKHYMLIVWNHGSGWEKSLKGKDVWLRGISYDDESGNHMSTPDLGRAMAAIGKVDVYGSDACLMQMPEVGYEIKDYADYIVGSEETEPADGYTYDTLLGPLSANPAMGALELSKVAVKSYMDHYGSQSVTQSAIVTAALPRLIPLLGDWTKAVMAAKEPQVVKSAHSEAQSYAISDNKDLLHFVNLVDKASQDDAVKSKGAALENFLANELIIANGAQGSVAASKGLAIYLPSYGFSSAYDQLAWSKAISWAKFAQWVENPK